MLLSVTGASGTGKSTALELLREVDFGTPVVRVEFDSIGVPDGADTAWRHDATERWVRFAQEARLIGRGEPADSLVHHLRFGQWFRRHSEDPQHAPEVIRVDTPVPMDWSRWETLSGDDSRWPVTVLDTDALSAGEVAERIEAWARENLADVESAEPRGR
jgi:hypothetical protein